MKALLYIPLLITSVFGSYTSGLNRTFEEVDGKIVDLYVTMPSAEVSKLIEMAQTTPERVSDGGSRTNPDFNYDEATIVVKWNGEEKIIENSSFKTGGMYARSKDKVGFNIKLGKKFLGRKVFKLRPDANDKSHLRSKLCCDISNRIGAPSIQGTYARLYMNNEYWGLYTLMDAAKPSWIKQTFNLTQKEVTTLFQCKYNGFEFTEESAMDCVNANDDYRQDLTEFIKFVNDINACQTYEEVEKILDVQAFLKLTIMEWLIGSFDHILVNGHNINFYKREDNGQWVMMEYDYDNTFGNGLSASYWVNKGPNQDGTGYGSRGDDDAVLFTYSDWEMNLPIINILVHQHKEEFKELVREVLVSAFNPYLLNAHIDELKQFLLPYVKEDTTPDSEGNYPGRINKVGKKQSCTTVEDFETNIETSLKVWIKTKFEVACKNFGFDENEIMEEAAHYVAKGYDYSRKSGNNTSEIELQPKITTTITTTTTLIPKTDVATTTTTTTAIEATTTATATVVDEVPSSNVVPTSSSSECKSITAAYQPCGGLIFPDASPCCEEGTKCKSYSIYYSMCTPENY